MTKKRSQEILHVKMEIFFEKKTHLEILDREKFCRPPKLGARSPPLAITPTNLDVLKMAYGHKDSCLGDN